jgi:hypothetical protein
MGGSVTNTGWSSSFWAFRLAKGGESAPMTSNILGVPVQTPGKWFHLAWKGGLKGTGNKQVSPERMELLAPALSTGATRILTSPAGQVRTGA